MSKLNRKEFKSLLLEWNKNFISERTSRRMGDKLDDIIGSNVQNLSTYNLEKKMQSLPILIIDIDNVSASNDEAFFDLLNSIEQDEHLSNPSLKVIDDPERGTGQTFLQWKRSIPVFKALTSILHNKNLLEKSSYSVEDVRNSSVIIFKDASYNVDYPYSWRSGVEGENKYDNALWTLHDVMHKINDHRGIFSWGEKSFEMDNVPGIFFQTVSRAVSHSSDKFENHGFFQSGEDFTATYIVFLYMYIIEVSNGKVDIQESLENLNNFLTPLSSQNQNLIDKEEQDFANIVKTKTKKILHDINTFLEEENCIQLLLFRPYY